MRHFLSSSLVIGSLAWYSAALPQPQGSAASSSTTSASIVYFTPSSTQNPALPPGATSVDAAMNVEEIAGKQNTNHCIAYYPPSDDPGLMEQCQDICGNKTVEAAAQGNIPSIMCLDWNQPWQRADGEGDPTIQRPGPGSPHMVSGGNCTCNDPFMNELATIFLDALPLIANIGCELIMNSLQLVAEYGAMVIPGVGQAVDAGMIAGIQAAKLAKYSFDATSDAVSAFQTWADPCGPSQLPPDVQNVFDILGSADDKVIPKGGWKPPVGLKQGGGKGN